ncbi:hypothetical protein DSO57_1036576 [Entomophthora muscae]|uniref:Uncharacterized protein n=1 Tax=Entomophthora muscae TaxID=34485 RepID=A0ACC2SZG1_9FUNG|nr:hypothetical protein DSO57_1036576 [Entomophthora muscae]
MSYIKYRLQAFKRLSGHYTKNGPRNLATKADHIKASSVKKIYWGIGGALVTAGVAGAFFFDSLARG